MWRNFVNGAPTARKGQLDWFFCKNCFLYAWGGPRSIEQRKRHGTTPKRTVFSQASLLFSQFGLKWCSPFWDKLILAWNGVAHSGTNWVWPEMVQPILGQNHFVPKWATPFQAKISLSQNGLHHFRPKSICPKMGYTISGRDLKQAGFLEVSISF